LDSYGPGKAPLSERGYALASRSGSKIYIGSQEIQDGESGEIGDGVPQQLLDFIGSTSETDNSPNYTNENYVTDGESLVAAISTLDLALFTLSGVVAAINWKAPVANFAALPAVSNVNGDVRLVLDTRIAYHWNSGTSTWKPLTGPSSGLKLIGGGTFSVTSGTTLAFTSDMYLEKVGLAYTDNTIDVSVSPIIFPNDFDVAYVIPNFNTGGPSLTVTVDSLDQVPLDAVIIARREGSDIIVGSSSTRIKSGQSTKLYAQESVQAENKLKSVDFLRSDELVTWTGTQLEFTSNIVLESLNARSGQTKLYSVLTANSPIALANGEILYVTIDREAASSNVTPSISATVPTSSSENLEIVVLAKRIDANSQAYLHIPLHKQVLDPGQRS